MHRKGLLSHRNLRALAALALLLAPTAVARAADTVVVGAVSSGSTNLWPVFIADRQGFFRSENIVLDLVYVQSNASVIQQIAANSINVSVGSGLADPIRAIEKGAPIALLRIETRKPPYALMAKPVIKRVADLKGKIVSVGGPKDVTRIFLERMIAAAGLAPSDVDLIFAGATSARIAALQSGAADAALLTTPYNFHAEAEGFTNLGLAADVVDMPFSGAAVNRDWAARNVQTVQRYIAAYDRAILWLEDSSHRQEAVAIMVAVSRLPREDVEKAYAFLHDGHFFETSGKISRARLGKMLQALKQLGDIPATMSIDRLFMPGLTQVTD